MLQRIWHSNLTGYFVLGGIILFALLACGSSLYGRQLNIFFRGIEPSCSIGLGTATITVQAWSADSDCQKMLSGAGNFTGVDWHGRYQAEQASAPNMSGSVVCEMDLYGRHVTVRDNTGSINGVGICTILGDPQYG